MSDFEPPAQSAGDAELQDFLMVEKQKAQVNAQVRFSVWIFESNFSIYDVMFL